MAGLHSELLEEGSTKSPISDQETAIKASENFRSDEALCPYCKRRPRGVGCVLIAYPPRSRAIASFVPSMLNPQMAAL